MTEIRLDTADKKFVSQLEKKDYFGQEVITKKDGRYLATVEALTDTHCWMLSKDEIDHSMKKLQAVREGRSTL